MLKLRNGDILKRVNQQALDNLADISLLLHAIGQHARIDLLFWCVTAIPSPSITI